MSGKNYHPMTHTTEHILNRTMVNLYSCGRSVSTHLEKKKSKCDYPLPRALTPEELQQIEDTVNNVIKRDLPVTESFAPLSEVPAEADTSKLPAAALEKDIRLISIGDYDICACIGPHVSRTSEILGRFKILTNTYENGILRLRWTVK